MTEEQLRALVREEVARQLAGTSSTAMPAAAPSAVRALNDPSHARFLLPAADGGLCIIEPRVMCTHCGYCKSYGH